MSDSVVAPMKIKYEENKIRGGTVNVAPGIPAVPVGSQPTISGSQPTVEND